MAQGEQSEHSGRVGLGAGRARANEDRWAGRRKVRQYGLLPAGTPGDVEGKWYQFTMTDSSTWYGMAEMAKAFRAAGFPEAERLTQEAAEYRQCILDVMHREEFVDPETKQLFIPNTVFYRDGGPRDPWWQADGPVQMFDTGLLHPTDIRFEATVENVKKKYGILMGMAEHIQGSEWYPNQTERSYYKSYLGRGEIEKALLVLYCNLLYGMAHDTLQTTERFHWDDANFSPLQPNASGNGRDINMLRRMVIDEQDAGKLWLLRGCPRRWFAPGQSISVENAPTLFGTMAIRSKASKRNITIDVDPPARDMPEAMTLLIRCPTNRTVKVVTINGKKAAFSNESVVLPREKGPFHVVAKLD
jgi:hypothetical protein